MNLWHFQAFDGDAFAIQVQIEQILLFASFFTASSSSFSVVASSFPVGAFAWKVCGDIHRC